MALLASLQPQIERIDALSLRERVLIFLAVCVVIVAIVDNLLIEPTIARQKGVSAQTDRQRGEIAAMQAKLKANVDAQSADKSGDRTRELDALKKELAGLDAQIADKQRDLVPPERMVSILKELLRGSHSVQIETFRSVEPTLIGGAGGTAGLYRHGVDVVLSGSYLDLLSYISALERLPVKIFWGAVEIGGAYPTARMHLTLFTLSLDKTWLTI